MSRHSVHWAFLAVVLAVTCVYSNHFRNGFHFDDFHTIVNNPYIRDTANIPRFFTDGATFSILPSNRAYRPVISALLAICYGLGGLNPIAYHAAIFLFYLILLGALYFLYQALLERACPGSGNRYAALFSTALFGLHPVCAETVNYIIQSAEVLSTAGVIVGLGLYIRFESARRTAWYMLPVILAILAKPPALIFPFILLAYLGLIERKRLLVAARESLPALAICAASAIFLTWMKPVTFVAGAVRSFDYWITQPYVALRYFRSFFLPIYLSVDSDLQPFPDWNGEALVGLVFVIALCATVWFASRRRELRPISFGIAWFVLALLPAALMPLAEVENDHRMFFPFAGLALAVAWTGWLLLQRVHARVAMTAALLVLTLCSAGTYARNRVWSTEETLWRDAARKSPRNGRALMNYGLALMSKGNYPDALGRFERATEFTPNYALLEINLGIVHGAMGNDAEAEKHFARANSLAPADTQSHFYRGRFLWERRRAVEAIAELQQAVSGDTPYPEAKALLQTALNYEKHAAQPELERVEQALQQHPTPEGYLNLSLWYHRAGRFEDTIRAAREALKLRPDYAEAYNNIAAAYEEMARWDDAIAAATQALRLKPDFMLARNNLFWSTSQKRLHR